MRTHRASVDQSAPGWSASTRLAAAQREASLWEVQEPFGQCQKVPGRRQDAADCRRHDAQQRARHCAPQSRCSIHTWYDWEGNLASRTRVSTTYAPDHFAEYSYDYRDRLTQVVLKNNYGVIFKTITYAYDALDSLVRNKMTVGPSGAAEADEWNFYDGSQIAIQYRLDPGHSSPFLRDRFLWAPAVDQLLSDEQLEPNSSSDITYWPLADQQNTVRDVAAYNTSTHVTSIASHAFFDDYGKLISGGDLVEFGFDGMLYDGNAIIGSQLYFSQTRAYDSLTGRWMSQDPIGFDGGLTNLHDYVNNSPTNFVDPTGLLDLTITPDKPDSMDWYRSKLPPGNAGNTDVKIQLLQWDPVPLDNQHKCCALRFTVKVAIKVQIDPDQIRPPHTLQGAYGHEQRHVQNEIDIINDNALFLRAVEFATRLFPFDCKNRAGMQSTGLWALNAFNRAVIYGHDVLDHNHRWGKPPGPPNGVDRPPIGTMPGNPVGTM